MGRNNKYETNVRPRLHEIPTWYRIMTEGQIAKRLGISVSSFEKYKIKYPELRESLRQGGEILIDDLKDSLRRKAKGFYYTETRKTFVENLDGDRIGTVRVEQTEKYAAPDTGAIHLLLKNLDDNWRNDDKVTMDLKAKKLEIDGQKLENSTW